MSGDPPTGGWLLAAEAAARARASRPVVLVPIPPPEVVGKRLLRCTYCNRRFKSAARYNLHWRVCHDPTNPMEEQG